MSTPDPLALHWLQQGQQRLRVLWSFTHPMTTEQVARRMQESSRSIGEHIRQLRFCRLMECLNPESPNSRVYWFTSVGDACRQALAPVYSERVSSSKPEVPWYLYGKLCFRHRRAVLLALRDRMRPAQVKRQALANDAMLRMSVDNCREVLHWMLSHHVVRTVHPRAKRYVFYELTEVGKACQQLMRMTATPAH